MRDPILLDSGFDPVDRTSYATNSFQPTGSRLVLAFICINDLSGSPPTPTLTGNGLTWTFVGTAIINKEKVCIYRAVGVSPSAGAVTIDFSGDTQNDVGWAIVEFPDAVIGGTNGSDAIVQVAGNTSSSAAGITVNLSTFASGRNMVAGFVYLPTGAVGITPGVGFTELVENTSIHDFQMQYKKEPDTSVDWTFGGTCPDVSAIAVEIKTKNRGLPLNFL